MDPVFETESETYSLVRRIDTWNLNAVAAGMLDADMSRGVTWSISLGDGADARRQSSRCNKRCLVGELPRVCEVEDAAGGEVQIAWTSRNETFGLDLLEVGHQCSSRQTQR